MTDDQIRAVKSAVDLAVRRHAGECHSPENLARRLAAEMAELSPSVATCESVRVLSDPDEDLVREVMEEPQDELRFEMTLRVRHPVQYVRVDLKVVK